MTNQGHREQGEIARVWGWFSFDKNLFIRHFIKVLFRGDILPTDRMRKPRDREVKCLTGGRAGIQRHIYGAPEPQPLPLLLVSFNPDNFLRFRPVVAKEGRGRRIMYHKTFHLQFYPRIQRTLKIDIFPTKINGFKIIFQETLKVLHMYRAFVGRR